MAGATLAQQPAAQPPRALRRALVFAAIAAFAGAAAGVSFTPERPELGAALGAGVMVVLTGSILALADWRQGFLLLMFVVLAEDSVRKGIPGAPGWINLAKDFVLLGCYLGYFFSPVRLEPRQPLGSRLKALVLLPIGIWYVFVAVQVLNPGLPHVLMGVSGMRTWMLYMPTFWLTAEYFRSPDRAQQSLNRLAVLALPFLAMCLLQNNFSDILPAFFREGVFKAERSLEGGGWIGYNESFFASPTLYALVCLFQLCLVIGLLKTVQTNRWTILLWASGYAAVAGAYLSGVRTALALMLIAIACLTPLMLLRKRTLPDGRVVQRRGLLVGGLVGLLLGALLVVNMSDLRQRAFWTAFDPDNVNNRVNHSIDSTAYFSGGFLGNGTGSAGASGRVMSLFGLPNQSVESAEWGTTVISYSYGQVGMALGFVVVLWFLLGMLHYARAYRNGRFAPLRYCLWVYLGAQLAWYLFKQFPVLENGTMQLTFWGGAGLIIGLYRLDLREDSALLALHQSNNRLLRHD